MSTFTPKERLLRVLRKEVVDRPPVICTGGMMNAAIIEVMQSTGLTLPEAHSDPVLMASLAQAVQDKTGFENIGVPFCMTIEAELLGSQIDLGTLACEPKITHETFPNVSQVEFRDVSTLAHSGRMQVVVDAARRIAEAKPELPLIASLTGPVSTAASIVDPMTFYKELRKNPDGAHRVLDYVTQVLTAFAERLLIEGKVTAVAVGDPSATGEILGPAMFEQYAVRYLNQLADRVHALGAPFIVHICGDLKRVRHLLPTLHCDAISTDAMISLAKLKADFPQLTTMGNLSTFALQWGTPDKIATMARDLVDSGVDILSPACGLSTSTTLQSIRAFTHTVKAAACSCEVCGGIATRALLEALRANGAA
jgi:[methyl-Co(III) methanol-specific corrinoid protein]:coenzyme M methyltransferase